jgi:cobalt transport protein ATP-binding subunit
VNAVADAGEPALFLLGHGTRDPAGVAELHRLADLVDETMAAHHRRRARTGTAAPPSGRGFIELAEPHVDEGLDRLVAAGAGDIVMVPYVLFGAGHLKDDGPAALDRARRRHPGVRFTLARDLGVHPGVLAVADTRATAALRALHPGGWDPESTAVVLVTRGSTDPDAVADTVKFARLLQDGRGLGEVHPAFVAMAGPDVATALDRAARLGATTIAVVPLLLFTGVLVTRIAEQATAWATDHPDVAVGVGAPLGPDAALAEVVVERYAEAAGGDARMNCDLCAYRVRLPGFEDKVAQPLTLAPPARGDVRGWRARRATAQAEREAATRRGRPRRGLGRSIAIPPTLTPGTAAVEVKGLHFTYPDGRAVLHGVDLEITAGERVALLGPNGAGKTTLVLHLLGVLAPSGGSVRVGGLDVTDATLPAVRRLVGLVFQDPDDQLFSPTVRADVAFGPAHLGLTGAELDGRVDEALGAVGLADVADRPPHHLSIGQRRRAALATVLAMHPQVLVLDEPTANLDPASRRDLADIIEGLALTILTVTHDLSFAAQLSPRAVVLDGGVVVADGPTRGLLASRDTMAAHRLELPFGFDPGPTTLC